jgi:hypothetical protein
MFVTLTCICSVFIEFHDIQTQGTIKKVRDMRFPLRDVGYSGLLGRYNEYMGNCFPAF